MVILTLVYSRTQTGCPPVLCCMFGLGGFLGIRN